MTTHTRLRLGTVALVLVVVLLLGGSHLCGVALDKGASDPGMRPIGVGALACGEFWLDRYQTLIAGLIAGGVALWAGKLLFKQVETQRFDFLARQLTDLQSIHASAWELWSACNIDIGPNNKIRLRGELSAFSLLGGWETKSTDFWAGIQKGREAIVRLETYARRPIGPSQTAQQAEVLARAAGEFLQLCQADVYPKLLPLGFFGMPDEPETDVRERHPETQERHTAISRALEALVKAYDYEVRQLRSEQARAHSVAR